MDHDLRGEDHPVKGLVIGFLICMPLWVAAGFACYWWVHR
jgi:hypothetical protein